MLSWVLSKNTGSLITLLRKDGANRCREGISARGTRAQLLETDGCFGFFGVITRQAQREPLSVRVRTALRRLSYKVHSATYPAYRQY